MEQGTLPDRMTLSPKEYAALEPFYRAQAQHKEPETWRQLKARGLKRIDNPQVDMMSICYLAGGELKVKYDKYVKECKKRKARRAKKS